jgi:hypothetical protein
VAISIEYSVKLQGDFRDWRKSSDLISAFILTSLFTRQPQSLSYCATEHLSLSLSLSNDVCLIVCIRFMRNHPS